MTAQPDIAIRLTISIMFIIGISLVFFAMITNQNEYALISMIFLGGGYIIGIGCYDNLEIPS